MSIQCLTGLTFDGIRFSKSSYTFDFSGKIANENRHFQVSTTYNLSLSHNEADACEHVSSLLWPFLEKKVTKVIENENMMSVMFGFENDSGFVIWADDDMDNLLVIQDLIKKKWFTVL